MNLRCRNTSFNKQIVPSTSLATGSPQATNHETGIKPITTTPRSKPVIRIFLANSSPRVTAHPTRVRKSGPNPARKPTWKGFGEILFHVGLCAGIGPDLRTRVGRIVTDGDELERDIRITGVDRVVVVIGIIPVS